MKWSSDETVFRPSGTGRGSSPRIRRPHRARDERLFQYTHPQGIIHVDPPIYYLRAASKVLLHGQFLVFANEQAGYRTLIWSYQRLMESSELVGRATKSNVPPTAGNRRRKITNGRYHKRLNREDGDLSRHVIMSTTV